MRRIVLALLLAVSATPLLATEPITFGPYQYDGAGNIFAIGTSESFAYDRDSRLVTAVMTPGTQKFGYDPFGNRTSAHTISGITHCNGGADCVRTPDPPVQPRTNRFADATYNAAGAIVTLDGRNYTYDATGMMTSQHNTQLVQYVYTADDERIAVYSNSRWEWSLRDPGAHVIRQVTSDDATSAPASTSWTWVDDQVFRAGAMLASERLTAGRRHFHLDHLGTPRLITADTGAIAAQYEYYPFGPQPDDGLSKEIPTEKLKFTGHERDLATGDAEVLDYMHARYYEGTAGRFLSVDPREGQAARPQSWNRYSYVENNPLVRTDPTGMDWWDDAKSWLLRSFDGMAIYRGTAQVNDSMVRSKYVQAAKKLDTPPGQYNPIRDQLKNVARENTSAGNRVVAELMDARPKGGLTASNTNTGVNMAMESAGAGGKMLLVIGVAATAANITMAPEGQRGRVAAQEAGAWLGALAFGEAGAGFGAGLGAGLGAPEGGVGAIPGAGIGAVAGGVIGGAIGAHVGGQVGTDVYDSVTNYQW